nr:hypothetical protein [Tanacetum cinerariifolium]
MGNEELNTIPEKESDEFIKSSVEDLVLIPSESEDTSESDSECILPSCDDFSPIDIPDEKSMTFPNPLFNSNNDFICSDNESLSDEDVLEDNVKIYSNPLSNLMTSTFLSGGDVDEINDFKDSYYDLDGDILYLESLLSDDTTHNLPLEVFLDRDLRSLSDAPIDNLMSEDKIFDHGIHVKNIYPTYVSLLFVDRHYIFFTYVVRILLLCITYPMVSHFLISSGSEDTILTPAYPLFIFLIGTELSYASMFI